MNDRKRMNCEMDYEGDKLRLLSRKIRIEKRKKMMLLKDGSDKLTHIFDMYYKENYIVKNINTDELELDLDFVCCECNVSIGRVDILCSDNYGDKIPIEVKRKTAGDSAVGQILGYMKALDSEYGIIIARDFSKRLIYIANDYNIKLFYYMIHECECKYKDEPYHKRLIMKLESY